MSKQHRLDNQGRRPGSSPAVVRQQIVARDRERHGEKAVPRKRAAQIHEVATPGMIHHARKAAERFVALHDHLNGTADGEIEVGLVSREARWQLATSAGRKQGRSWARVLSSTRKHVDKFLAKDDEAEFGRTECLNIDSLARHSVEYADQFFTERYRNTLQTERSFDLNRAHDSFSAGPDFA